MNKLALTGGVVLLAVGAFLLRPASTPVAKADQIAVTPTVAAQAQALKAQLIRERRKHKLDRVRIARELRRLHRLAKKYKVEFDKSGIGYQSPRESSWICVHEHEGAWNSNTGNGYYGGLQMDMSFQRTYGSEFLAKWGTANNWPWRTQIMVAERAYNGYAGYGPRGFGPWPNTRLMCGV